MTDGLVLLVVTRMSDHGGLSDEFLKEWETEDARDKEHKWFPFSGRLAGSGLLLVRGKRGLGNFSVAKLLEISADRVAADFSLKDHPIWMFVHTRRTDLSPADARADGWDLKHVRAYSSGGASASLALVGVLGGLAPEVPDEDKELITALSDAVQANCLEPVRFKLDTLRQIQDLLLAIRLDVETARGLGNHRQEAIEGVREHYRVVTELVRHPLMMKTHLLRPERRLFIVAGGPRNNTSKNNSKYLLQFGEASGPRFESEMQTFWRDLVEDKQPLGIPTDPSIVAADFKRLSTSIELLIKSTQATPDAGGRLK